MIRERRVWNRLTVAVFSALAVPLGALGQELRLGSEFQVNTRTTNNQRDPTVAALASGEFVVAWNGYAQDGPHTGVFARRFSAAGVPLAGEFQVNAFTLAGQYAPSVAAAASGDFIVAWIDDYFFRTVFARRFSSAGVPLANEFQVNTRTVEDQYAPSVAASPSGEFVVAWSSQKGAFSGYDVFARPFSSAGAPLASEFQVNSYTEASQYLPSVASLASGDFVVAWMSFAQDGFWDGVFARRFSSAGAPLGSEFQVNVYTHDSQFAPSVAATIDGDFMVAWGSQDQVTMVSGVFARRFSSAGAPLTDELQLSTDTAIGKGDASVAVSPSGEFIVTWSSSGQDGASNSVFARRVSRAGAPLASEFQVNTYTSGAQSHSSVAAGAAGRFVVAWNSYGAQDGSGIGVFAQRFAFPKIVDIDGNESADPLTDGLLLLRYLFGFRGAALTTGAIDLLGCSRCDASSIETYLAGILLPLPLATRIGSEFLVNSYTSGTQADPAVAADNDGDFVVAWMNVGEILTSTMFGRRFSATGAPLADDFQISLSTTLGQGYASVANAGGSFVVAWQSGVQDGSSLGVFGRRFASTGAPLATELQLNSYTTNRQSQPSVAVGDDGDFVVAWDSAGQDGDGYGIFARSFSSDGIGLASEFQVNVQTVNAQADPSVGVADGGDFVVAWQSHLGQDGSLAGIFARRFSSAGSAVGVEIQVNAHTMDGQYRASVALDADGDFVVAWESYGEDGSSYGVFARRFSSTGTPLVPDLQANTWFTGNQHRASVAAQPDGDFVVAWQSYTQDGSGIGIFARQFSSAGSAIGEELQVNSYTTGNQRRPAVAADAHGRFVVVWYGPNQGANYDILAQRFVADSTLADVDGDGMTTPLTDGLLVLRYLFGFRGATLTAGVIGSGCLRCDATSIEAFLQGLSG